jgi:hypothetical protein
MQAAALAAPEAECRPETPFPLGPFLVERDGRLHARQTPALRFAWRGRYCEARLAGATIRLTSNAGAVPYTAEDPAARRAALAAVGLLPGALPPGWRLRLLPDHRLRLEAEASLPTPITATALIGRLVAFALALDPYLDRLESAGAGGAPSAVMPGIAKT